VAFLIPNIKDAPFLTSVFGETLETIMENQKEKCPEEVLPKILVFLVDSILKLRGYKTEGIFRISGQIDEVSDLRCRIEQNRFDLTGIKGAFLLL
jgi:hypothetical protein